MDFKENKINKDQIPTPKIEFTATALNELKLIIENDFTLAGKYFRLLISGKGCDGFTYSCGFTDLHEDDFLVKVDHYSDLHIVIDPFAAFYLQNATVDFILDPISNQDGFIITNHSQDEFKGKFWKSQPQKTPPIMELH